MATPRRGITFEGIARAVMRRRARDRPPAAAAAPEPPHRRQKKLDRLMGFLGGSEGPFQYTHGGLAAYARGATAGGEIDEVLAAAAALILRTGGGAVYLAGDRAILPERLSFEFPELGLMGILPAEAFAESPVVPHLWVERPAFVPLRVLAPVRAALRARVTPAGSALGAIAALLGLPPGAAADSPPPVRSSPRASSAGSSPGAYSGSSGEPAESPHPLRLPAPPPRGDARPPPPLAPAALSPLPAPSPPSPPRLAPAALSPLPAPSPPSPPRLAPAAPAAPVAPAPVRPARSYVLRETIC